MEAAEQEEFVAFVDGRGPTLRRAAFGLCGDWHEAEDLLQTALLKVFVVWPRVRRRGDPTAYTRTVLVRAFLDEQRRPFRRERPQAVVPDMAGDDDDPSADRPAADVRRLLDPLPRRQRAVLFLRFVEDLSVEESARVLQCSAGTVKSQTHEALQRLRVLARCPEHVPPSGGDRDD